MQQEILKAVLPGLPAGALEPCFLKGREVKEMGLMGRRISGALDRVRRAQWEGTVKNHDDAVALLKR